MLLTAGPLPAVVEVQITPSLMEKSLGSSLPGALLL